MDKRPNLQSLNEFVESNKDLVKLGSMRDWIFHREKNGADMWIRRIGRRIFIDVDKFFEWTKRKI